jgi:NAD(P)-dependent dehydrogenase (short-subunit alcohol dehydrogenase family)
LMRAQDKQKYKTLMAKTSDIRPGASSGKYQGVLSGRVAVVTGAGAGIGRAIAERFAQEGASVVVGDFNDDMGRETAARITKAGGTAVFQHVDCTIESEIEALMERAVSEYGRLDHLVNNAVRFVFGHLRGAGNGSKTGSDRDITDADWDVLFKTNVMGYARCIKHALSHIRKNKPSDHVYRNDQGQGVQVLDCGARGSIVNVASISSFIAQPEFVPCECPHPNAGSTCAQRPRTGDDSL